MNLWLIDNALAKGNPAMVNEEMRRRIENTSRNLAKNRQGYGSGATRMSKVTMISSKHEFPNCFLSYLILLIKLTYVQIKFLRVFGRLSPIYWITFSS